MSEAGSRVGSGSEAAHEGENTRQSAAEEEEEVLVLQQALNARHHSTSSTFSASSVDRFLRENGFQLDEATRDDDVLSSSADEGDREDEEARERRYSGGRDVIRGGGSDGNSGDDDEAASTDQLEMLLRVTTPLGMTTPRAANASATRDEGDVLSSDESASSVTRRSNAPASSNASSAPAAGDDGDAPTPRFILLEDDDLLSVANELRDSASLSTSSPMLRGAPLSDPEPDWRRGLQPQQQQRASPTVTTTPLPPATPARPKPSMRQRATVDMHDTFDRSLMLGGFEDSAPSQNSAVASATGRTSHMNPTARQPPHSSAAALGAEVSLPSPIAGRRREEVVTPQLRSTLTVGADRADPGSDLSSSSERSSQSGLQSRSRAGWGSGLGSAHSRDDELSDALGVRSSLNDQEIDSSHEPSTMPRPPHSKQPTASGYSHEEEKSDSPGNPWSRPPSRPTKASYAHPTRGSSPTNHDNQKADWTDINILLRKSNLPTIQLQEVTVTTASQVSGRENEIMVFPAHDSVVSVIQDFVLQLDRKNQTIQDLIMKSKRSSNVQNRTEENLESTEKKNENIQRALTNANAKIARLREKVKHEKDAAEKQVKVIKASCLKLQQQLKVSEHRVKAKEVLVERMQQRMQQQVDKEALNKTRDRKAFKNLQQREPRRANAKDNQSLECINIYETQKEQMLEDLEHLRAQVTALNSELRDKENYISRASSLADSAHWAGEDRGSWHGSMCGNEDRRPNSVRPKSLVAADEMLERLEAARREQEQAAARLRQREAVMIKKISVIEKELVSARETIAELKEEHANLTMEAESRPSIRDYRISQRRIHQLERQLSENKLALEEANDISELRKFMGTTELIERDRLNHRLHLNRLGTLPRETLLEVVKEVCRVLNLTDITLITPSLHKLCNVVSAVPRMEKFIRDVCGFVYYNARDDENQREDERFELEQVLPTLQRWMTERKKLHELEGFKVAIVSALCRRSVEPPLTTNAEEKPELQNQLSSLPRAVRIVSELIELEKGVLHHREIYTQAAAEIERRPSVLVNQIVRHFSGLFQVKSIEGVLPKINEVYMFTNEMQNFLKVLRIALDLRPDTSIAACLDVVRERLEADSPTSHHANHSPRAENPEDDEENFVVQKSRGQKSDSSAITGVRKVREMSILIRDLKKELGAATIDEILPRTKRLMELLSLSIHTPPLDDDDEA